MDVFLFLFLCVSLFKWQVDKRAQHFLPEAQCRGWEGRGSCWIRCWCWTASLRASVSWNNGNFCIEPKGGWKAFSFLQTRLAASGKQTDTSSSGCSPLWFVDHHVRNKVLQSCALSWPQLFLAETFLPRMQRLGLKHQWHRYFGRETPEKTVSTKNWKRQNTKPQGKQNALSPTFCKRYLFPSVSSFDGILFSFSGTKYSGSQSHGHWLSTKPVMGDSDFVPLPLSCTCLPAFQDFWWSDASDSLPSLLDSCLQRSCPLQWPLPFAIAFRPFTIRLAIFSLFLCSFRTEKLACCSLLPLISVNYPSAVADNRCFGFESWSISDTEHHHWHETACVFWRDRMLIYLLSLLPLSTQNTKAWAPSIQQYHFPVNLAFSNEWKQVKRNI